MLKQAIIAEQYPGKVGAAFDSVEKAELAADQLEQQFGIRFDAIEIVKPKDRSFEQKLEPEGKGIRNTVIRSNVTMGVVGVVVGGLVALCLHQLQIPMVVFSPYYTTFFVMALCGVGGLLLGGLISLRPDHDRLIQFSRQVTNQRRWMLLVHVETVEQKREVKKYLHRFSDEIVASL